MKIRQKTMTLLLAASLLPAAAVSFCYHRSMSDVGGYLATQTREILIAQAQLCLQNLVSDYGRLSNRTRGAIELALARQAREVELRLAAAPPRDSSVFFSHDYDTGANAPEDVRLTDKYRRYLDGREVQIPVSFSQQVFFLAKGTRREQVARDTARLSTMPEVYRELYRSEPELIVWLYTGLETGLHSSYPGHGGYPADFDPRARDWYARAKENDALTWTVLPDVSTRRVALTASMPVRYADGSFAGVTAIDIQMAGILETINLPASWQPAATVMHVVPIPTADHPAGELRIIAQESYDELGQQWRQVPQLQMLDSEDRAELAAMRDDVAAGRPGVRRLSYHGADCLWAYGQWRKGNALAVVVVPYEVVTAQATETEKYHRARTLKGLRTAGIIHLCVLLAAVAAATTTSRYVTGPIYKLAAAARKLAGGDFTARADIETHDELQQLGDVFNELGPRLDEHQKMKQSLALAREIQQHLLPQEPPKLPGFDIWGLSVPADETGGDYYDFIELVELGADKCGIALGDVTGHGIGAALLMASARSALRNQAQNHGEALDALFAELNTSLLRDTGEGLFMTLFYGVLDARRRSLLWTSGGHDPALWARRRNGQVEQLGRAGGIPLGILPEATYAQAGPVALSAGDIVAIGTDGIWEATDPEGRLFGKDRLKQLISRHADLTAERICQEVVRAVADFRGRQPQADDITLVIIKALSV